MLALSIVLTAWLYDQSLALNAAKWRSWGPTRGFERFGRVFEGATAPVALAYTPDSFIYLNSMLLLTGEGGERGENDLFRAGYAALGGALMRVLQAPPAEALPLTGPALVAGTLLAAGLAADSLLAVAAAYAWGNLLVEWGFIALTDTLALFLLTCALWMRLRGRGAAAFALFGVAVSVREMLLFALPLFLGRELLRPATAALAALVLVFAAASTWQIFARVYEKAAFGAELFAWEAVPGEGTGRLLGALEGMGVDWARQASVSKSADQRTVTVSGSGGAVTLALGPSGGSVEVGGAVAPRTLPVSAWGGRTRVFSGQVRSEPRGDRWPQLTLALRTAFGPRYALLFLLPLAVLVHRRLLPVAGGAATAVPAGAWRVALVPALNVAAFWLLSEDLTARYLLPSLPALAACAAWMGWWVLGLARAAAAAEAGVG